jgi:hypothetical protein
MARSRKSIERDYKQCSGPCQQLLGREEFDTDNTKSDGLRSWCKQCRKKKELAAEFDQITKVVQSIEGPILATLGQAQTGGTNIPHQLQVIEGIVSLMGGIDGFVAFYVAQIMAAPPGGVIRERMLNTVWRAIQLTSDDARVQKPRHLQSDEELEAQLQTRLKLLVAPIMEKADDRRTA